MHVPTHIRNVRGFLRDRLNDLRRVDEAQVGGLSRLYDSGVYYLPEQGQRDDWTTARGVVAQGHGDCEDLSAYLAAERRVRDGVPADVDVKQVGRNDWHAFVRSPRGVEDPARELDPRNPAPSRASVSIGKVRAGYRAAVRVPVVGACNVGLIGTGATPAAAYLDALHRYDTPEPFVRVGLLPRHRQRVGAVAIPPEVYDAGVEAGTKFLEDAWGAIEGWLAGPSYDAWTDYLRAVGRRDAVLEIPDTMDKPAMLARILAAGWIPIWCSDSSGTRDDLLREFSAIGWTGKGWGQEYGRVGLPKSWWYGATFKLGDAPADILAAARASAASSAEVGKQLSDAKGQTVTYGAGVPFRQQAILAARAALVAQTGATPAVDEEPPLPPPSTREDLAKGAAAAVAAERGDWDVVREAGELVRREGPRSVHAAVLRAVLRWRP